MGLTLRSMHLGDILLLGQYTSRGRGEDPVPLRWMKATPNGDFITEGVVDLLQFDAAEEWPGGYRPPGWPANGWDAGYRISHGDTRLSVSTLLQYLNSAEEVWFEPQHDYDVCPPSTDWWGTGKSQTNHFGFLRFFAAHEIAAMIPTTVILPACQFTSKVRIPTCADVYDANTRLNVFKKKRGVRAKPTEDLKACVHHHYHEVTGDNYYLRYFLADPFPMNMAYLSAVGKSGLLSRESPSNFCGIRPLVTLNPRTRVEMVSDGVYQILPKGTREMKSHTDAEMLAFFGITQP